MRWEYFTTTKYSLKSKERVHNDGDDCSRDGDNSISILSNSGRAHDEQLRKLIHHTYKYIYIYIIVRACGRAEMNIDFDTIMYVRANLDDINNDSNSSSKSGSSSTINVRQLTLNKFVASESNRNKD